MLKEKLEIMTVDDVKEQLQRIKRNKEIRELKRAQTILVCTTGATITLGIVKGVTIVSPLIDNFVFSKTLAIKTFCNSSYMFMNLIPIPNYYLILLVLLFVLRLLVAVKVDCYTDNREDIRK